MTPEYDVIWNGAHKNSDSDLLCIPRIPPRRPLEPMVFADTISLKHQNDARELEALQVLSDGAWHSVRDLGSQLDVSSSVVYCLIKRLRMRGRIQRGRPERPTHETGFVVYRLKQAVAA